MANEALQDPFNAEKEAAALDRRTGLLRDDFEATSSPSIEKRNLAFGANPIVPATVTVEVLRSSSVDADVAELQVCEVNSWVVVEVGAGPNGADAIVDPRLSPIGQRCSSERRRCLEARGWNSVG